MEACCASRQPWRLIQRQLEVAALDRHIWYHDHAAETSSDENGVRLSFALMYWRKLADEYPPAMAALKELKTLARTRVLDGNDPIGSMREHIAICRNLGHQFESRDFFLEIHRAQQGLARQVFPYVLSILVEARDFKLCDLYLEPGVQAERINKRYNDAKATEADLSDRLLRRARKRFKYDASVLVALLRVNGHRSESQRIASRFRAVWDDPESLAELDEVLIQELE